MAQRKRDLAASVSRTLKWVQDEACHLAAWKHFVCYERQKVRVLMVGSSDFSKGLHYISPTSIVLGEQRGMLAKLRRYRLEVATEKNPYNVLKPNSFAFVWLHVSRKELNALEKHYTFQQDVNDKTAIDCFGAKPHQSTFFPDYYYPALILLPQQLHRHAHRYNDLSHGTLRDLTSCDATSEPQNKNKPPITVEYVDRGPNRWPAYDILQ